MQTATPTSSSAVSLVYGYRDATGLGRITAGLLAGLGIFFFRYLLADLSVLLNEEAREERWREELLLLNLDPGSSLTPLLSNTFLGLFVAACVLCFAAWLYRVSSNSIPLQQTTRFPPFWAVCWFLIPIFNLWKPYQVMKELLSVNGDQMRGVGRFLALWWAPHILLVFPFTFVGRTADEVRDAFILDTQFRVAQELVGVAMLIMATFFVLRLTGLQQRAAAMSPATKPMPQGESAVS